MNTVKYSELEDRLSGLDHREVREGNAIRITVQLPMADNRFGDHRELELKLNLNGDLAEIVGVNIVSGNVIKEVDYSLIADWLELQ